LADFICHGLTIVEVKAVSALDDQHRAQVHNYLKATDYQLGVLVRTMLSKPQRT